jgi:dipeptidyl aminopeptidase/acylaminoacyl peptidase
VGGWILDDGGHPAPIDLGGIQPSGISRSATGAIAFAGLTPTTGPEIYFAPSGGSPRRLTHLSQELESFALGRSEGIEWTVEPSVTADGVLTYPPGYEAGHRYPLVLWFHGGPMGASTTGFLDRIQLMAARGWLVLQPNFRGSVNRGNRFQSAIIADAGDGPGRDVMAGVATLIHRGIVDTTRMAIAGWSYGGFMTTWMMGHYRGWRAAVAGAAVTDHADQYNLSDIGVTYAGGWGGSVWTDKYEALLRAQSPISSYRSMTTPTLILSNTGDERVPIVESFKLYHALKDRGIPVQFIAYPIGGHVPSDPVRWRDVYRRMIDWIAQHFGSQP